MNLALDYLNRTNQRAEDYDGFCGELADKIISPKDSIVYVEGDLPQGWRYHMVALIEGKIHDAWCLDVLPIKDWLARMFGAEDVVVSLTEPESECLDIYAGPANEFHHAN